MTTEYYDTLPEEHNPNPCDQCHAVGGALAREYQGERPHGGMIEYLEECPACLGNSVCPGCAGELPEAFDVDADTCGACGWAYDEARHVLRAVPFDEYPDPLPPFPVLQDNHHEDTPDLVIECDCGVTHALYAAPGKAVVLADYAPCECGRAMEAEEAFWSTYGDDVKPEQDAPDDDEDEADDDYADDDYAEALWESGQGSYNGRVPSDPILARLHASLDAAALAACEYCDGSGRIPNWSGCGELAGGWADICQECDGGGKRGDLAAFGPLAPLVAGMRDALDAAALALACAECLAATCTTPCAWCAAVRKETA